VKIEPVINTSTPGPRDADPAEPPAEEMAGVPRMGRHRAYRKHEDQCTRATGHEA
jgi:hypothetical protein